MRRLRAGCRRRGSATSGIGSAVSRRTRASLDPPWATRPLRARNELLTPTPLPADKDTVTPAGDQRRRAVALKYAAEEHAAPQVAATGTGDVAERILAAAREAGIPVREDPDLTEALAVLDLGAVIPPELYSVIAEVLAWAYRANADYRRLNTT